jgi:endo-1,4-beta-xylanase
VSIYRWEKFPRARRADEPDAFTPALEAQQQQQYTRVFNIFKQYKNVITGVTFWNVSDRHTWLDEYPVKGRKNYPLLFDQQRQPKNVYYDVIGTVAP